MAASDFEQGLFAKVFAALGRWLRKIRDAVLGAGGQPDPSAVLSRRSAWNLEVANLMPSIEEIAAGGWTDASGRPYVSTSTFIMADLARAENFLRNVSNEVYALLVAEMIDGQQAGEDVEGLRRRIDRVLDLTGNNLWAHRAQTIAQTESNRAWNAGVYASALYYEPQTGPGWTKSWNTRMDGRERKAHELANEQTVGLRDLFQVGTPPVGMRYPGDPSAPAGLVINCVPGSALISACGVEKAYRYSYSGPMVALACESGQRLTVSPNHPVLTVSGWVAARQLRKGDHLIGAGLHDGEARTNPDVQNVPSTADQIFRSLLLTHASHRVVGLPVDLHGDGPDGEIEIVLTHGPLAFGLDSSQEEPFEQLLLASADAPSAPQSPQFQLGRAARDPAHGGMRWSDLLGAFSGRHTLPLKEFGLGLGSQGYSGRSEGRRQGRTRHSHAPGEGVDGFAPQVVLNKLISIEWLSFDGHLYTFQTTSGAYMADSIISHNCRCSLDLHEGPVTP